MLWQWASLYISTRLQTIYDHQIDYLNYQLCIEWFKRFTNTSATLATLYCRYKYCDGLVFVRFVSFRSFFLYRIPVLGSFFLTSCSSTCIWKQHIRRRRRHRRRCFSFWQDKVTVRWIDDNRKHITDRHKGNTAVVNTQKRAKRNIDDIQKQERWKGRERRIDVWWNRKDVMRFAA